MTTAVGAVVYSVRPVARPTMQMKWDHFVDGIDGIFDVWAIRYRQPDGRWSGWTQIGYTPLSFPDRR